MSPSTPPPPSACQTAEDVSQCLARRLGHDPAQDVGVLHVAAVWESKSGPKVIRVGEHAPKSAFDAFVLHVARARAEVIVTTGRILRDEPTLHYDLGIALGFAPALEAYRERRVGLRERARLVVLTRGRGLDLSHPALHGWARPVLHVPEDADAGLEETAAMHAIEVRRVPGLDLDRTLETLASEGVRTVSVEAGVSTTMPRYARGSGFDELMLGRYEGDSIDARAVGEPFPDRDRLERYYGPPRGECHVDEASGPWSFVRYRRTS